MITIACTSYPQERLSTLIQGAETRLAHAGGMYLRLMGVPGLNLSRASLINGSDVLARSSIYEHWPEYLIEGFLLWAYMVFVCSLVVFLASPWSHAYALFTIPYMLTTARAFAIGLFATLLIHTPWGKRSGGHLNPAITLAFYSLRRIRFWDAFFYIIAQFVGASVGVLTVAAVLTKPFTGKPVSYAVTVPGPAGAFVALVAESVASFLLMYAILFFVGSPRQNRFTGVAAGFLTAILIIVAAPYSGASMNPARSTASALSSSSWTYLWLYFVGPVTGMLAASKLYVRRDRAVGLECAKLLHPPDVRCIHCGFEPSRVGRLFERVSVR